MKKLILTLAASAIGLTVFGQGQVSMNTAQGTGATAGYVRFSNIVSQAWATNGIVTGLYYGPDAASCNTLAGPVGGIMGPAQTANSAQWGFILSMVGGTRTTSRIGVDTYFQIRAWSAGYATYEDALAAGLSGVPGVMVSFYTPEYPMGPISHRITTPAPAAPVGAIPWGGSIDAPLIVVLGIPEPSVIVLVMLGLAVAFLLRCRTFRRPQC